MKEIMFVLKAFIVLFCVFVILATITLSLVYEKENLPKESAFKTNDIQVKSFIDSGSYDLLVIFKNGKNSEVLYLSADLYGQAELRELESRLLNGDSVMVHLMNDHIVALVGDDGLLWERIERK